MIVNLMKEKQMFGLTLPQKVKGQYWLSDFDDTGAYRQLVSIEAVNDKWFLKSNKKVLVIGEDGRTPVDKLVLTENAFVNLQIAGTQEKVVLFTEALDNTRQMLSKIKVTGPSTFAIGRTEDNHFSLDNNFVSGHHAELSYDGENWYVSDMGSRNGTYVNGFKVQNMKLKPGDCIYIMGLKIVIGRDYLALNNPDQRLKVKSNDLALFPSQSKVARDVPDEEIEKKFFFRSPRFFREIETVKVKIDPPPTPEKHDAVPMILMLGPSLTMAMSSICTGLIAVSNVVSNNGQFIQAVPTIVMTISMLLGAAMWPVITKKHEKREKIKKEKLRQEKYLTYLNEISDQFRNIEKTQSDILNENLVTQEECVERIIRQKTNLWERVISQDDFLKLRLGTGTVDLDVDISYQEKKFVMEDDSLQNAMLALAEGPKEIKNVPISVSLKENKAVGIYGSKDECDNLAMGMLLQLVALHSYDELKIMLVVDEHEEEKWSFAKYMPHLWDADKKNRFFAKTVDDVRELSTFLEKNVLSRREKTSSSQVDYSPHYVMIVTSTTLRKKCTALEQILEEDSKLGFSVLMLGNSISDFPKETEMVIGANGDDSVIFKKDETTGKQICFKADRANRDVFENVSVQLANIELDLENQKFVLPNMLTFLEMFNVGKIEHLNVLTRWKENDPTKTLQAPVGVGVDGDMFMLDLHEKFHGPHGLVAGMTGSGKSEFIITYILSLAVNYHPDEVSFILIDYKGGGLTGAFENEDKGTKLPHLAGTITNLDGAAIKRSLVSIQSELRRRQAIFNDARKITNEGTMDIYKYQKLYRDKVVSEPVPHLFIISDEFAELKTQQPEFMEQLISAARIGRSLGVHLILATQKPSGVVDDQIWSNSKFRVCLKVQEKADSQEMIKRPDAAEISQTGRFYLQVGFNELFALGQSAWCGAEYVPSETLEKQIDTSVRLIDNLGRTVLEAKPNKKDSSGSKLKQLVQIVEYLDELAKEEHAQARPLWLEPIPPYIYLDELEEKYSALAEKFVLNPVIGEYDDPYNQKKGLLTIPLSQDGNCIVYGATGNGKTTFLTTMCYGLLKNHTVEEVNLYIVDCGSETLRMFDKAPHVGGVITSVEEERIRNLLKMVRKEIEQRRALFSEYGGDYESYIRHSGDTIPNMVVMINDLPRLIEQYEELQDEIFLLSREGIKYGVYFVVTASNPTSIRYKLQQNFKIALTMQLNDESDYPSVVGKTEGVLPSKFKGRGLVRLDKVYEFQTANCVESTNVQDSMRTYCALLAEQTQTFARKVPTLPDIVSPAFVKEYVNGLKNLPLGVDKNTLAITSINMEKQVAMPVLSQSVDEMKDFLEGLTQVISKICTLQMVDTEKLLPNMQEYQVTDYEAFVKQVFAEMVERNNTYKDANMNEESLNRFEEKVYVIIGFKRFYEQLGSDAKDKMKVLLEKAEAIYKIHFVIADAVSLISSLSYEQWYKVHVTNSDGVWVSDGIADQFVMKPSKVTSALYDEIGPEYGYVMHKNKPTLVKLLSGRKETDYE